MKLKRVLSFMLVLTIVFSTFLLNVSFKASASYTNFYVDQVNGNDNNSGTSINSPFKTLARMQGPGIIYSQGDIINLKRGCTWNENLQLRGGGTVSSPCVVTAYGTGAKPKIKGGGFSSGIGSNTVIGGLNLSNWNINNIQVEINNNTSLTAVAAPSIGIEFVFAGFGYSNICIEQCDVYGYGVNTNTWGIRLISVATGDYNGFLNVGIVKNCTVYNVGWAGIAVTAWNSSAGRNMHATGTYNNIQLDNNVVHNTGVQGIFTHCCTQGQMNYNYVYSCGTYTGTGQTWGAVGIWTMMSSYIDIMNNEVYWQSDANFKDPQTGLGYDAGGIDIDWSCQYIDVAYNFVHANYGPGIETMANNHCNIYNNNIADNQCLTSIGQGQIALSDYTDDTDYVTGVNFLAIHDNRIWCFRANTAAITTKRFSPGSWTNNAFYNNTVEFNGATNTNGYYFDPAVSYQPFSYCDYNYFYGSPTVWFGCYHLVEGAATKSAWSALTLRRGGLAYDVNSTLN